MPRRSRPPVWTRRRSVRRTSDRGPPLASALRHPEAVQRGARVLATARPEVANYVTSLGAAQALDYTQGDLVSAVHTLYPGGVDAVLDVASRDPAGLSHISQVPAVAGSSRPS